MEQLLTLKINLSSEKTIDLFLNPLTVLIIVLDLIGRLYYKAVIETLSNILDIDLSKVVDDWNVNNLEKIIHSLCASKILLIGNKNFNRKPLQNNLNLNCIDIKDVKRKKVLKYVDSVLYWRDIFMNVIKYCSHIFTNNYLNRIPRIQWIVLNLNLISYYWNLQKS